VNRDLRSGKWKEKAGKKLLVFSVQFSGKGGGCAGVESKKKRQGRRAE
jgi:hypothetical protein